MPTSTTSGSCGLGAIQRTCEVHGRGGKLHSGREGMSWSATSSSQLSPPSRLRNRRLGSVPAYTAPSAALTATLNTSGSGNGTSSKVSPPSALRFSPPPRHPTYTVSPSSARHCAPEPCRRVRAPTLTNASPVVASNSIATGSRVTAAPAPKSVRGQADGFDGAVDPLNRLVTRASGVSSRWGVGGCACGACRPTAAGEEGGFGLPQRRRGRLAVQVLRGDRAPVGARAELPEDDGDDAVHPPDEDRLGWQRELVELHPHRGPLLPVRAFTVTVRVAPGVGGGEAA